MFIRITTIETNKFERSSIDEILIGEETILKNLTSFKK